MLDRLYFLMRYYLYWIIYFIISKEVFVLYHFNKFHALDSWTQLKIFVVGLRLDASFAAYLSILPFTLLAFSINPKIQKPVLSFVKYFTYLCVIICTLIVTIDLELYRAWGFRIDATPLMYLSNPDEMMASAGASPIGLLIFIWVVISIISIFAFHFLFQKLRFEKLPWLNFPIVLFFAAALIIPIRGGLQLAPINQSAVYFSNKLFANHAAINPLWNFADSWFNKTADKGNPYQYLPIKEVEKEVSITLQNSSKTTEYVIDTTITKPNVLIITWESLTAKVFDKTGGLNGVLPELGKIADEGILFRNCFASGDRSDKGLIAILSAFPAQPTASVMTMPKKTAHLPILSQDFKKHGYRTAWYYGGEPEFANIKSYMLAGEFDQLITKENFDPKDMNSKWGAHDHVVFNRLLHDLNGQKEPFFVNYFTLSSHEPFEVPMETVFKGDDMKDKFINAHHYTDKSLGKFIAEAKKQDWWKNTIVIIVADHGHPLPNDDKKIDNFHIPMVWTGGALKVKGKVIDAICSQNDLVATLLAQLRKSNPAYQWSKNIFQQNYQPSAYYVFNDGFGWVAPKGNFAFDNQGKNLIETSGKVDSNLVKQGKAYLQLSFQAFLNL